MVGYLTIFREPATIPPVARRDVHPRRCHLRRPDRRSESDSDHRSDRKRPPRDAQSAATAMGVAFSDDINAVQKEGIQDNVTDLERQLGQIPPGWIPTVRRTRTTRRCRNASMRPGPTWPTS